MKTLQDSECPFSEVFLQALWNEQAFSTDLRTTDGRPITVLHAGIWNRSAGPDFKDCAILLDGTLLHGPVEIHKRSSDWFAHGHDRDSAYSSVILHVVWENDSPPVQEGMPVFLLPAHLHPNWRRLLWQMEDACYSAGDKISHGECALRWAATEDTRLLEILRSAGHLRFWKKTCFFKEEILNHGEDQALYGALLECLGYKENRLPFRMLSELVPISELQRQPSEEMRQALLFGTAGMLPDLTQGDFQPPWDQRLPMLWECWLKLNRPRPPRLEWSATATRPYNTAWRRLAGGIELLEKWNYAPAQALRQLLQECPSEPISATRFFLKQLHAFAQSPDGWKCLRDFRRVIAPPAELLGRARLLDMAANIFLPFLNALLPENSPKAATLLAIWDCLPRTQENHLFKEAALRFFQPPSRAHALLNQNSLQQGLLHVYQNFCQALQHTCLHCPLSLSRPSDRNAP